MQEPYLLDSKNGVFRGRVIGECVNVNARPLAPEVRQLARLTQLHEEK